MSKRSGKPKLKLLGRSDLEFPEEPSVKTLETFPNRSPERGYWITFDCPEFTSMCPVTGQPDFAKIQIRYIPGMSCLESKSLKFYLASYRNTRSFAEEIVNRVLEDLVEVLAPKRIMVHGEFSPRGGINVTVEAEHPERK